MSLLVDALGLLRARPWIALPVPLSTAGFYLFLGGGVDGSGAALMTTAWMALVIVAYLLTEWALFERRLAEAGALDRTRSMARRAAAFAGRWLLLALLSWLPLSLFLALILSGILSVQGDIGAPPEAVALLSLFAQVVFLLTYAWLSPMLPSSLSSENRRIAPHFRGRGFIRRARRLTPAFLFGGVSIAISSGIEYAPLNYEWVLEMMADLVAVYVIALIATAITDDFVQESATPIESVREVFE